MKLPKNVVKKVARSLFKPNVLSPKCKNECQTKEECKMGGRHYHISFTIENHMTDEYYYDTKGECQQQQSYVAFLLR